MAISADQCRAARALLGWSAADLAKAGEFGIMTVKRLEGGQVVKAASLAKVANALSRAGIELIESGETSQAGGQGVRFASS